MGVLMLTVVIIILVQLVMEFDTKYAQSLAEQQSTTIPPTTQTPASLRQENKTLDLK